MQSLRAAEPLPEGANACVFCRRPDLAITEVLEYLTPTEDTYVKAGYLLKHWHGHDGLLEEKGLGDLRRYCHGHTAISSDVDLKAPTREAVITQWNARNPKPLGEVFTAARSFWKWIFR